jgi:pectate lyase
VSGTIALERELVVDNPFITIAGQTAPGGGVCVSGYQFRVRTHDVIIRGMRFRVGDRNAVRTSKDENLQFVSLSLVGRRRTPVYNVIIDHCSISWSIDKNLMVWTRENEFGSALHDVTIQWCISSEALYSSFHPKGDHHAMGMSLSVVRNISVHHNLIAHCNARNPQFAKFTEGEGINNVVYNWTSYATEIQTGAKVNLIGNYYKAGKNMPRRSKEINVEAGGPRYGDIAVYVKGNIGPNRTTDGEDEWSLVNVDPAFKSATPVIPLSGVVSQPAAEAYRLVVAGAGAFPRDAVDQRVVADVENESGKGIASQVDIGGWPMLSTGTARPDSDGDGMPDEWESLSGLNPRDDSDASRDSNGDGYTNIEEYINQLIE